MGSYERLASVFMNPSPKESRLKGVLDPQRFAREYEAESAENLESFLPTLGRASTITKPT